MEETAFDRRAVDLVMEMMAIPGPSGREGRIVDFVTERLRDAGVPASCIETDSAYRRSPIAGAVGNLIVKLPGTIRAPRRMLMAHLDTVALCVGCRPVRRGAVIRSADPRTGLGADDRAGSAAVLSAALELRRRRLPHPPLTFLWTVQEEVGLQGARNVALGKLGRPKAAFNFDGGSTAKLTIGATGAYRLHIQIDGLATHAGLRPEEGVSAIAIAAVAVHGLIDAGLHGRIERDGRRGTSNVGVIHGGSATNVVADSVGIDAEIRSHDAAFRAEVLEEFRKTFADAADRVRNVAGQAGHVRITERLDYESFELSPDDPCVRTAASAVRESGLSPILAISDGGVDANWLNVHGVPTVTIGAGQRNQHMTGEHLVVDEYLAACRIALRLATAP